MAFFGFGAYNMDNYSNISAHLNGSTLQVAPNPPPNSNHLN
jgi:hypothetical protein